MTAHLYANIQEVVMRDYTHEPYWKYLMTTYQHARNKRDGGRPIALGPDHTPVVCKRVPNHTSHASVAQRTNARDPIPSASMLPPVGVFDITEDAWLP